MCGSFEMLPNCWVWPWLQWLAAVLPSFSSHGPTLGTLLPWPVPLIAVQTVAGLGFAVQLTLPGTGGQRKRTTPVLATFSAMQFELFRWTNADSMLIWTAPARAGTRSGAHKSASAPRRRREESRCRVVERI